MGRSVVATNRKASFKFHLGERFEAGIALLGAEVKTVRDRQASLDEAFARFQDGELFLVNCHLKPYAHAGTLAPEAMRMRKLLLHKRQLLKLAAELRQRGTTLVPLSLYFNDRGFAKVEIALARGKRQYDKREAIRKREHEREIRRASAPRKRG